MSDRGALVCRMAHQAPWAWAAWAVLGIPLDLFVTGTVAVVCSFAMAVLTVVVTWAYFRHDFLSCGIRLAMTALDAAAAVARCRRRLWAYHHGVAPVVVLLAASLLVGFGFLVWLTMAAMAALMHIHLGHEILRPWCPHCGPGPQGGLLGADSQRGAETP